MRLIQEQLESYKSEGFLFLQNVFSPLEVAVMKAELPSVFAEDSPRRVIEKDGKLVRSVYGTYTTNEVFWRLTRHPRIVEPIMQILESPVYVYQFKINAKAAFGGDIWDWHQDYIFWRDEDGMPSPRATNALIFLDDVTEFNGPLYLIAGSHREGVVETPPEDLMVNPEKNGNAVYRNSPGWISNLTANLKYSLNRNTVAELAARYGMVAPKGPAGSVLFFHGNLVHGSPKNISPFDRYIVIVTFNSVENIPVSDRIPRPDFLVSRDHAPVTLLPDNALLR